MGPGSIRFKSLSKGHVPESMSAASRKRDLRLPERRPSSSLVAQHVDTVRRLEKNQFLIALRRRDPTDSDSKGGETGNKKIQTQFPIKQNEANEQSFQRHRRLNCQFAITSWCSVQQMLGYLGHVY
jgi:hypothetical protein